MANKIERMKELSTILFEASKAYYAEDREIMTNLEYDRLYDELTLLEQETGTVLAGSPTVTVGYTVSSELVKERHPSPLLSLDKTKDPQALAEWLGDKEGLLSWKLDGLTVVLTYRGGKLTKAVTRGNGTIGEVVTANAAAFENVPLRIPFDKELSLRGEAVIRYSDFEKINEEISDESAKYKNPRNLASGSVRQLDSAVTAKRYVRWYMFSLVSAEDTDFQDSREAQMKFVSSLGFETVEYFRVDRNTIEDEIKRFALRAAQSDLPSDGLVLTFDDILYGESLGKTSKFPRDAIAFKWKDELSETILREIEWSASRTGLINPIAVFDPVEIEGTTVSRAGVHNISIMEELELGIGDTILVYKANMIIPQIAEDLTKSANIEIPTKCPVCDADTAVQDSHGVKSLCCTNEKCLAKQIKSFTHFVSRNAINIDGLSESTLEKFIAKGFISEFADLFRLEEYEEKIVQTEGFGRRSADKLFEAIEAVRNVTKARLLFSLGIPGIGLSNAKAIAKALDYDWTRIENADIEELTAIDGIGEILAEGFVAWFADSENRRIVGNLLALTTFDEHEQPATDMSFENLTFVITGALESYPNREALKELIESKGGKTSSSVSAKTDYLINNDVASGSSKNKKAKELGVKIITEATFKTML